MSRISGRGKWRPTKAADNSRAFPSEPAVAAGAAVGATAAAGILVVGSWIRVGGSAAGVTRRTSRVAPVRITFVPCICQTRERRIGDVRLRSGDSFAL